MVGADLDFTQHLYMIPMEGLKMLVPTDICITSDKTDTVWESTDIMSVESMLISLATDADNLYLVPPWYISGMITMGVLVAEMSLFVDDFPESVYDIVTYNQMAILLTLNTRIDDRQRIGTSRSDVFHVMHHTWNHMPGREDAIKPDGLHDRVDEVRIFIDIMTRYPSLTHLLMNLVNKLDGDPIDITAMVEDPEGDHRVFLYRATRALHSNYKVGYEAHGRDSHTFGGKRYTIEDPMTSYQMDMSRIRVHRTHVQIPHYAEKISDASVGRFLSVADAEGLDDDARDRFLVSHTMSGIIGPDVDDTPEYGEWITNLLDASAREQRLECIADSKMPRLEPIDTAIARYNAVWEEFIDTRITMLDRFNMVRESTTDIPENLEIIDRLTENAIQMRERVDAAIDQLLDVMGDEEDDEDEDESDDDLYD